MKRMCSPQTSAVCRALDLGKGEASRRSRAGLCISWFGDSYINNVTVCSFFFTPLPPRYSFPPCCSFFHASFHVEVEHVQYGLVLLSTSSRVVTLVFSISHSWSFFRFIFLSKFTLTSLFSAVRTFFGLTASEDLKVFGILTETA